MIFTDLDGTFLNHDDYSFDPSQEALAKIKQTDTPLIFNTSKTKAEVILLQQKVGIIEPFITENGAALFIPKGYQGLNLDALDELDGYKVVFFGKQYNEVVSFYKRYKDQFALKGFCDMSIDEIIYYTNLAYENAHLAKQRDFTEPFMIKDDSKIAKLAKLADQNGLKITKGGRFFHLIAKNQDKGVAVKQTQQLFQELFQEKIFSFGFGDGENDIPMFQNVDQAIVIQNNKGNYAPCSVENVKKSSYQGSAGFNEMVLKYVF
ncbi:HAD-IIB family hydrolase [Sulfurimonas sp.]